MAVVEQLNRFIAHPEASQIQTMRGTETSKHPVFMHSLRQVLWRNFPQIVDFRAVHRQKAIKTMQIKNMKLRKAQLVTITTYLITNESITMRRVRTVHLLDAGHIEAAPGITQDKIIMKGEQQI